MLGENQRRLCVLRAVCKFFEEVHRLSLVLRGTRVHRLSGDRAKGISVFVHREFEQTFRSV
jgi:hypothetical protein